MSPLQMLSRNEKPLRSLPTGTLLPGLAPFRTALFGAVLWGAFCAAAAYPIASLCAQDIRVGKLRVNAIGGVGPAAVEKVAGAGGAANENDRGAAGPEFGETSRRDLTPIFHLQDGGRVAGVPQFDALDVETQYGKLEVPREQIRRIRFARRLAPELRQKIDDLVADLGSDDFDLREGAMAQLEKIGPPAITALRGAMKSPNEEVKSRAGALVGKLLEAESKTSSAGEDTIPRVTGTDDEVVTVRMTIRGKILRDAFVIRSLYGDLRVDVADLIAITLGSSGPAATKADVTAQHQPPGNWLDSKLDVERGDKLKISAAGQISVRNYGIVSGPAGNTDWSGHQTFGNFPMLSLVGKVGKSGEPFLVGPAYTGKAKDSGRLYLAVVAFSPYPTGAAGGYQVKAQTVGE